MIDQDTEKHTDPIDVGSQTAANFLADSIKARRDLVPEKRAKTFEEYEPTEDDLECEICGEPNSIPPRRAYKGYNTCVSCSEEFEHRSKGFIGKMRRNYDD